MNVHADAATAGPAGVLRRAVSPVPLVALTVVWVVLWGTYDLSSVVFGLLVSVTVLVLFPMPHLPLGLRLRPVATLRLGARFLVDLVISSCQVAYRSVAPWWRPRGGLLRVGLMSDDELLVAITAEMIGLVPGTVVVDVDRDRRELLLHVFHVGSQRDLDVVCRSVHARERRVLAAFAPSPTEEVQR